jgi:hypothetical protein
VPCRLAASSKYELFVRVFIGSNYYFADYMRITSLATTLFIACGSRCLPVAAVQRVQASRPLPWLHGICNFFLATATTPLYPCHGYHLLSCRTARLTTKIAAKPFPPYSDSSYITSLTFAIRSAIAFTTTRGRMCIRDMRIRKHGYAQL